MVKLLLCLTAGLLIAICLLGLRQQRLELNNQANRLHNQIEAHQAKLWSQQLQIAVYTAPNAIQKTVGDQHLKLTTLKPATPAGVAAALDWIDPVPGH